MTSKDYNRVREETKSEKESQKGVEAEDMGKKGSSIKQGAGSRGVKKFKEIRGCKISNGRESKT